MSSASISNTYLCYTRATPVKTLLQDLARSCKKRSFFLHPCKILRDLAGFCRNLAGFLHKIPARFLQNPARSRRILQDLVGVQEKKTFSCKILQERFYWDIECYHCTKLYLCTRFNMCSADSIFSYLNT